MALLSGTDETLPIDVALSMRLSVLRLSTSNHVQPSFLSTWEILLKVIKSKLDTKLNSLAAEQPLWTLRSMC